MDGYLTAKPPTSCHSKIEETKALALSLGSNNGSTGHAQQNEESSQALGLLSCSVSQLETCMLVQE